MNEVLAVVYLVCFAAMAGGAFALMTQTLRRPEAPQPGDAWLYVDFSRERLEQMYQESP